MHSARPSPGFKKTSDSFYQMFWNFKNMNQSPFKDSAYNLIIIIITVSFIVCLVFGPFIRPLLWAFLFGAVLFPFKYNLAYGLKRFFHNLEETESHLVYALSFWPIELLVNFGEYLTSIFIKYTHILIGGTLSLFIIHLLSLYTPKGFLCSILRVIQWGHSIFTTALSSLHYGIVIVILLIYISSVLLLWKPEKSFYFMIFGQTLWIILTAYGCSFLGAFQVPVFLAIVTYAIIGMLMVANEKSEIDTDEQETHELSFIGKCVNLLDCGSKKLKSNESFNVSSLTLPPSTPISGKHEKIQDDIGDPTNLMHTPKTKMQLNIKPTILNSNESTIGDDDGYFGDDEDSTGKKSQSGMYFKVLFLACLITIIYNHVWMVIFAIIPIILFLTNKAMITFGIKNYLYDKWIEITSSIKNWFLSRYSALLPLCLPGVLKLNERVHAIVITKSKESIDTVSSVFMIILLILTVTIASVFCAVQIYSETIAVVQLGNDVVNWTYYHRPELMDIFPEGTQDSLDNIIENAYQYGRTGIETYVDEFLKDADVEQKRKLKLQVLSIWDRIIQYWVDRQKGTMNGPVTTTDAISDSIGEIVYNEAAQQGIIGYVKTNIGVLMEVLDSVWIIVKTNLNIITSIFGTIFYMLLSSGHVVITFLVNTIIFLTALFYLLSSSEEKYAPLVATNYIGFSSGSRIAEAIESSISSVLMASAKLVLFHGLFTWLTHTIFGARIVFLPAVFAALLAAVPFLGTYWCSLPAFLDLWLIQDRFSMGLILLLTHFLFPSNFVDPAIYADVNGGGHAYLTGLSIAGGMYWLGWEGAIFGPILLCILVVVFNLTSNSIKENSSMPKNTESSDFRTTGGIRYLNELLNKPYKG